LYCRRFAFAFTNDVEMELLGSFGNKAVSSPINGMNEQSW